MEQYACLKALQDSAEFDTLRAALFNHPSVQAQFRSMQEALILELRTSPLLDVPHRMRMSRLAVRNTSIANDIHVALCAALAEMIPTIYQAIDNVNNRSAVHVEPSPSDSQTNIESSEALVVKENCDTSRKRDVFDLEMENSGVQRVKKKGRLRKQHDVEEFDINRVRDFVQAIDSDPDDDHINPDLSETPEGPVAKRVQIWWPLDKAWYSGTCTAFRSRDSKYHIRYDDLEFEWLDLNTEKWRYE